jgi:hypothetical protein
LELASPLEHAPSIGPKSAARLAKIGICTVADLLAAEPIPTAKLLGARHIKADTLAAWQQQARLVCEIPGLRGVDAQILVACNLTSPAQIAALQPDSLLALVQSVCQAKDGERILRAGKMPGLAEVTDWIAWSGRRRNLEAA